MFAQRLTRSAVSCFAGRRGLATAVTPEVTMLQTLLTEAKARAAMPAADAGSDAGRTGPKFNISTFNAISKEGLKCFNKNFYEAASMDHHQAHEQETHAILLRSHKLQVTDVPSSTRCIARCGAGTNNIPVDTMTGLGIPVFNTPGANANSVKEAVVCGLLLASRGIVEGINHTQRVIYPESKNHKEAAARIEKDKKMFVGHELAGKTLGVVGLGQIGGRVVEAALALGMNVTGFDPSLSMEAAWQLPGDRMERAPSLEHLLSKADYVTLHLPHMPATHHLIGSSELALMKPQAHLINFSRGELVDTESLADQYGAGTRTGKYISDFGDEHLHDHPKAIVLPHLGASTEEAEENSARMAAATVKDFLVTGSISNSVNFPTMRLPARANPDQVRITVTNRNEPGALGAITTFLGQQGLNISQQLNMSRGEIAYSVVDVEDRSKVMDGHAIQEGLGAIPGVITSRIIGKPFEDEMGNPGTFYKVYASKAE